MKDLEIKLNELNKEDLSLDLKWNELLTMLTDAFRNKNGYFGEIPLDWLGLTKDYDNYLDNKMAIEQKKKELIVEKIENLSKLINIHQLSVDLIDYRIPFSNIESHRGSSRLSSKVNEVITYFIVKAPDRGSLLALEHKLLKEPSFFNIEEVTEREGKFGYRNIIKWVKEDLRKFGIYSTKGTFTILGKYVKENLVAQSKQKEGRNRPDSNHEALIGMDEVEGMIKSLLTFNDAELIATLKIEEDRNLDKHLLFLKNIKKKVLC